MNIISKRHMNTDKTGSRIIQILDDLFNFEGRSNSHTLCQDDIKDWDSIGHIRLMLAIEHEFGIKIPLEKAVQLNCIEHIIDYIDQTNT